MDVLKIQHLLQLEESKESGSRKRTVSKLLLILMEIVVILLIFDD